MSTTNQLRITELDYDTILANLVDFMRADPTFSDYDFTGSGLRLLARVLAYVTFYNGVYLSSAINEAFLDTAQLRSSVVSHARMLGYNTHGVRSARCVANVSVQVANTSALAIDLPRHTQFILQANNAYTFYNINDTTLNQNATTLTYDAPNVALLEGKPATFRFVVDLTNPTQRFIIPNANVDFSTFDVSVFESATSNVGTTYQPANSRILISATDAVYWTEESYSGFPEIRFGNGIVGLPINHGNIIQVDYFISRGETANDIRGPFKIGTQNIPGFIRGATDADANTETSSGGAPIQSVDEIKFLAPLVFQTQNRCVTADDYKAIILRDYGENIAAINVFGGEQGDPNDPKERPILGKIFIVVKPKIGLHFTDITRQFISQNIIRPYSIVGTIPEVIDPDYIFVIVNALVKYEPKNTTLSKFQLQDVITTNIAEYADVNIEKFDTTFRFSKLIRVIDDSDDSITSSLMRLDLEKRFVPRLNASNQAILKYGVPIRKNQGESAVLDTMQRFSYPALDGSVKDECFFHESDGTINVVNRAANGSIQIIQANIGLLDATAGLITLTNFAPISINNNDIEIFIRVRSAVNDFSPRLNLLYTVEPADIDVTIQNDTDVTPNDMVAFYQGGIL